MTLTGKLTMLLAGAALLVALGFWWAWSWRGKTIEGLRTKIATVTAQHQAAVEAQAAALAAAQAKVEKASTEIAAAHADAEAARKERFRVLSSKATFVPAAPDQPAQVAGGPCPPPDCSLPLSGLCLLDAGALAAAGGVTATPCEPDGAPTGITYPVTVGWVLRILDDKAHNDRQLADLQRWVLAQQTAYSQPQRSAD